MKLIDVMQPRRDNIVRGYWERGYNPTRFHGFIESLGRRHGILNVVRLINDVECAIKWRMLW